MTDSIYKCENHSLDLVCRGCMKAWIARHDKMLEFVKDLSQTTDVLGDVTQMAKIAKSLLKEIGEL